MNSLGPLCYKHTLNSIRSMTVKSFLNRVMILAGVQACLSYFVGGMNDPVRFAFVTSYEVD